jgi:transposase
MDMSAAYIEAVRRRAPGAQIIFDRFHAGLVLHPVFKRT